MEKIKLENRNYDQNELDQMLIEEKITALDYVTHISEERTEKFKKYCEKLNVPQDDDSAGSFMNFLLREEEKSHTEGLD